MFLQEGMRPIRYCLKCGEYVADSGRYVRRGDFMEWVDLLIHIDADGREIHRAHAAVEDVR